MGFVGGQKKGKRSKRKKRRKGRAQVPFGPKRNRPRGYCVCTACGAKVPLYTDVPCYVMSCPKCGMGMVKEGVSAPVGDQQPKI